MMFGTELLLAAALLGPAQQPPKPGDSGEGYTLAGRQAAQKSFGRPPVLATWDICSEKNTVNAREHTCTGCK